MGLPVRRLLVRGTVAAAITLGSVVVLAPTASADGCAEGSTRIFFSNSTNTCLGPGTTSYDAPPAISKVCSAPGIDVAAEATFRKSRSKTITRKLELSSGNCGRFDISGQIGATVTVS